MKRVILTGGTGMLGIALMEFLIQKEIEVLVIIRPGSKRRDGIPKSPWIHVLECDLADLRSLEGSLEGYDTFFHFAWDGTYGEARNDMYLQNKNVRAVLDAVHLAKSAGCRIFLGAGSQAEYGRVDGVKLGPDTPVHPETGYGIGKLCAGQMSRILCQQLGMKHIWVRILSTYGPHDGLHTMVMSGIIKMLNRERPQYTKGEQMWDYLYCGDAARAFYLAAERGIDGSVYCIGSGQVRPLADYIRIIRDTIDPSVEVGMGEVPYYDKQVMYLCADIENLKKDTGFEPQVSFEEGIQRTVDWYKEEMKK
ncbi:MAG: NAD(P)-dependent oxidoreductase [Lachnospiraceae bacterium]|nr:NAD(P)-dependent oxidoreductase [Lachnospiraceae bacterium]MDD6267211.1 NAD(P)-dependent oxidoreductase [Clostridium sp.]